MQIRSTQHTSLQSTALPAERISQSAIQAETEATKSQTESTKSQTESTKSQTESTQSQTESTQSESFQQTPPSISELSPSEFRRRAGVKKPSLLKRLGGILGQAFQSAKLALSIGPALGHIVLARELSTLDGLRKGEAPQPPLDWLRDQRPQTYANTMGAVLGSISGPVQQALGLSLTGLRDVEEHYFKALAPVNDENGFKTTAPFIRELAKMPYRAPGEPPAAFVFLGEKLQAQADSVTELWNSEDRPPTNPFPPDDQRSIIWSTLERSVEKGRLPVFVDLDGDYSTFTGTEYVAKRTLESITERHNPLGGQLAEPGRYLAWLTVRQEALSQELEPYFKSSSPVASMLVDKLREDLGSPWLGGSQGLGPWSHRPLVAKIPEQLEGLRESEGTYAYVDALVALDRDVVTGLQSHWVKTVRESSRPNRQRLTDPLPGLLFELNLRKSGDALYGQVAPIDAPEVSELIPSGEYAVERRPYDRAVALGEVVDRTLTGVGIEHRRELKSALREQAKASQADVEAREQRLRDRLGAAYPGLEVHKALFGTHDKEGLLKGLEALDKAARQDPKGVVGMEARRHGALLELMATLDTRYGDIEPYMSKLSGQIGSESLGVSEHFVPPDNAATISPLRTSSQVSVRLGNPDDPSPMKISQVFEGGGGRGFAYVECLKQLETALDKGQAGYEIDEYVGTSAGSMVALLLAAGFRPDELRPIVESIDFKGFNSDAAWLLGGVDPKARGVDRTGLFSTQKMYQTFHDLLSQKLGIEGRPVLFSDLPHRLKLVTTVMNTDLPEDHPLRDHLDSDGRFVFSTENTPHFDVAGALAASAAVPAFFQSPQFQIANTTADGELSFARMQLADGGTVDNLSISSAENLEERRSLLLLPAHTRTRHPETGEWVNLDTLNFDTGNLDLIDAHNRDLYAKFAPQLDTYLQGVKSSGVSRAVVALNLVRPSEQRLPVIQGSDEDLSLMGILHAREAGFPILNKEAGDKIIRQKLRPPSFVGNVAADLFDRYMDNQKGVGDGLGHFHRDSRGFHFEPPTNEMTDIFELGRSAGSAALSAGSEEYEQRRFEKVEKKS